MLDRIGQRLSMAYVGILALILILFGIIVVVIFSQQATAQQDELLRQKAEAEMNSAVTGTETYAIVGATAESDIAVVAVPPDGSVEANVLETASSGSSLGLPFGELARQTRQEENMVAATVDGPDGPVRVVSMPLVESGEMTAIIQAAQSRQVVREMVNRLVLILVSVGLVALLLAGVGGLFISRRAIRPVRGALHRQRAFVGNASHELKTPLTLIKLNAELVAREPTTSPRNRKVIEDQLSEIDRMNTLVSDLLVLARLDTDKLAISCETFDLAKILAETADRFILRAAEEEILLDIEVPGELPALGDPKQTGQILAALLDNAMQFTPSGGRVIVAGRSDDGRVEASVTDTGPGISSEHLPHVFERFYRADTDRRRSSGGRTGLGLAIARDLAAIQGGDLVVSNAKNGGASFTLSLPVPGCAFPLRLSEDAPSRIRRAKAKAVCRLRAYVGHRNF
jgi:signal transduction histidine kinase